VIEPTAGSPKLLDRLNEVLASSRERGLLGPGDPDVHVRNALGFASAIGTDANVVDLGSGGGVPGLVLLVRRPDLRVVLLDSARRRIDFLRGALAALADVDPGIDDRAEVLWGRAEDLARDQEHRDRFEVVVSRSFGRPAVTAECARPFLCSGGRLIVSEPPAPDCGRWPPASLERLGLRLAESYRFDNSGFVVLEALGDCPDGLPRRTGVAERRPAF
jgi:16S rRNA (guanine527-N7)-methyltransferase